MNLLKYVNVKIFLASLVAGLFLSYMTAPLKQHIYVYPSEENMDSVQFKDITGTCFSFEPVEVNCPSDAEISRVPIQ
jgi:hypothetical protein